MQRSTESAHHTTGGYRLTAEALKQLAVEGCDLCGAYKIKHQQPKGKSESDKHADDDATNVTMYYDSFGRVSTPSAQYGYHYAHLFWVPA